MIINDDRTAANKAFDVAFQGDTTTIDDDMATLFEAHRIAAEARGAARERARVVEWIREKAISAWGADCTGIDETGFIAFAIERGDHYARHADQGEV